MSNGEFNSRSMPPPYTEGGGNVTVTSGVVYQGNPAPAVMFVSKTMSPNPAVMTCPSCNQDIVTRVEYKSATKTHLFAVLLCLVFWPCVCLPYCIGSCQNADHYCPNCSAYIGSYTT